MEAPGNNQAPIQCRAGCGFYGTAATEGMCSKCYKDYLKKTQQPPSGPAGPSFRSATTSQRIVSSSSTAPAAATTTTTMIRTPECIDTASPTVPVISASVSGSSSSSVIKENAGSGATSSSSLGAVAAAVVDKTSIQGALASASISSDGASAEAQPCTEENPEKKKKNRCAVCKKKVGLTGFGCRCGGLFCSMHRYSDKHDCTFDYRTHGAEEIRKNNPVVKGEKIKQI